MREVDIVIDMSDHSVYSFICTLYSSITVTFTSADKYTVCTYWIVYRNESIKEAAQSPQPDQLIQLSLKGERIKNLITSL